MCSRTAELALASDNGGALLVGHSYGGAVITEAGNDPSVVGLVYIAAFAPSDGESVNTLIANPAPGAPVPPILRPVDGYLFLDKTKFQASFAGDVASAKAGTWRGRRRDHCQGGQRRDGHGWVIQLGGAAD